MNRITTTGLCLLVLVVSAEARSLPKSDPAPKVEACDDMGPGFVKIEGSETCVKISGHVRAEVSKQGSGAAFVPSPH